jgi:hypothetical protein
MTVINNIEKARNEISFSIISIAIVSVISLLSSLDQLFDAFSHSLTGLQAVSLIIYFISSLLFLGVPLMLKRGSKHALTLVAAALGLCLVRWFLIEQTFQLNLISVFLLLLFTWYIACFIKWVRVGALT